MGLGSDIAFTPVVALGIFAASIAGSVHCVGMCGGLMLAATGTRLNSQIAYHLSRLFAYLSIGALAGYLGKQIFSDSMIIPVQIFFTTIFLLLLLSLALSYFFGWGILDKLKLTNATGLISEFGMKLGFKFGNTDGSILRASLVGFFTVFLPCGWLYSFVLLSIATHSVIYGALTLTLFWLGTIPALMSSRIIIQGVMSKIGVSGTRAISFIMIAVAFLSVFSHWRHVAINPSAGGADKDVSCHETKN